MLDFLGIGAQKAGTTWLYERLRQHPEIHFPHPDKEIHFWSAHYPRSLTEPGYRRDLDWYRRLFNHWEDGSPPADEPVCGDTPPPLPEFRRGWFDKLMAAMDRTDAPAQSPERLDDAPAAQAPRQKWGEISPSYCCFDDPAILPKIHEFAPGLRLIYIVRHPFDRAWSAAQMAVRRSEMQPEEASDQWYIDHFRSYLSQKKGDYARAITQWRSAFSAEQLLVLRFEDIPADPHGVLRRCCEHIGVTRADYFDAISPEKLAQKVFAGGGAPLRPSLIPVLRELYAGKIATLKRDFGIDYPLEPVRADKIVT